MAAVEVQNGFKYYGRSADPNKKIVLNFLNMTVMPGTIYGLLGASGCGKTTLLSCIIGQRKLNSGEIRVFGKKPGSKGSGIPGPLLGYMPQEIALVKEMTVKGTIYYFGRIYGLSDDKIRDKYKLLNDLLELPPAKQLIGKCSGGQQRRVSFACALVHQPELLILDEPTVGLDPILREKIWDFLVDSTKNSNLAVIITTHYIEEAKQANCLGLMRNGILLAEGSPENIMHKFHSTSIEDAFLILSQHQGKSEDAVVKIQPKDVVENITNVSVIKNNADDNKTNSKSILTESLASLSATPVECGKSLLKFTSKAKMKALMVKNVVQLTRHLAPFIFTLLFPLIQVSCFFLAVGHDPWGLKLGVVNYEVLNRSACYNDSLVTVFRKNDSCEFHKISCRFLDEIDDIYTKKIFYNTEEEALAVAKRAKIIGYLVISPNFTESMHRLLDDGRFIDEASYLTSVINVRLDLSDYQVGHFVERKLRDSYSRFSEGILTDCNISKDIAKPPIRFEEPVYGTFDDEFQRFVTPGVIMTMIFFLTTLTTTNVFITERSEGVWDRTLVAGVSTLEMLLAHTISQVAIMVIQCCEVILYIAFVFGGHNSGDNITVIALLILNGFTGMLFGLVVSIYCKSHTLANFVATGTFYPMIILCGILWPLEGMPTMLRQIALTFPFTIPTASARNVLEKGWPITNSQVYNGFLVTIGWIILLSILCVIGLKRKT